MTRAAAVLATLAALVVTVGLAAGTAWASVDLGEIAGALRADPVYVDTDAERALSEGEIDDLRSAIRSANTPIYIAIVPASAADLAGGDAAEVASQLADAVGRPGTYGVVVGDRFRAGSTELPAGEAADLAQAALDANGADTAAVLNDFVDRVADAAESSGGSGGSGGSGEGGDDSGSSWVLPAVIAAGAGGAGLLMWRRSRRRQAEAAERARAEAADRELLKAEISVLADDVVRLEPEVEVHPEARSDFDAAVGRYRAAQAAVDYADQPIDLIRVARVVAEARYSMDRARAILEGRDPPAPPDDLQRPGRHGEPAVTLDDDRQPAYVGYPGGFQSGWFGGTGGGLFSGLLLGSLLAGGFGGWGYGGTTIINEGDDGGGGDFGGGDFGGGDFGGGDFGGGDFGGGDFGGGDFGGGAF
jgi:hypothetical protein